MQLLQSGSKPSLVLSIFGSIGFLIAPGFARADAGAEIPALYEHSFYDCRRAGVDEKQNDGDCRVFYSVYKDRIAVVLKDPQKAMEIPEPKRLEGVRERCLKSFQTTSKDVILKKVPREAENVNVAIFELAGTAREEDLLCLAGELKSSIDNVVEAGAVARIVNRPGLVILLDSIQIGVTVFPDPLMHQSDLRAVLGQVGLKFIAPDPFDPHHGLMLKAFRQSPIEAGEDLATDSLGLPDDPLLGIDLMVCTLREGGVDECLKQFPGLKNPQPVKLALTAFQASRPFLVTPTFLPIAPKGEDAGFDAWLAAQIKEEDSLSAKITFNSTSNTTDTDDRATLSVDASLRQGSSPDQLRFDVGAQVEFDNGEFEENVTNIRVNYDYYFRPWLELYGFAERFTNTFLGIEQRWEGGGGFQLEYDFRTGKTQGVEHLDQFCDSRGLRDRGYSGRTVRLTKVARHRLAQYRESIRNELVQKGYISRETAEMYCDYQPGIVKRNAVLQLGLALSVFSDFERPDQLELTARPIGEGGLLPKDSEDERTAKLAPDSSQTMRLTIRPTVTWRPADRLTLESWYYFKISDDKAPDGGDDYRTELTAKANFVLNPKRPEVSLTASYSRFFDSAPPVVSLDQALGALGLMPIASGDPPIGIDAGGQIFQLSGLTANDDHEVVKFGVTVNY